MRGKFCDMVWFADEEVLLRSLPLTSSGSHKMHKHKAKVIQPGYRAAPCHIVQFHVEVPSGDRWQKVDLCGLCKYVNGYRGILPASTSH